MAVKASFLKINFQINYKNLDFKQLITNLVFSSFKGLFGRCQDIFAYFCSEEVCIQIKIPFALKETVGLHYDTVSPKLILTHL